MSDDTAAEAAVMREASAQAVEPGGIGVRALGLFLDGFLVLSVSTLLVIEFVFPRYFPGAIEELMAFFYNQRDAAAGSGAAMEPSPLLISASRTATAVLLASLWLYFTLLPATMNGSTLGSRVFGLRIVRADDLSPAGFGALLLRGLVKSLCLILQAPVFWLVFLVAVFNRDRLAGHDFLSRTRVIRGPVPVSSPLPVHQ